MTLTTPHSTPHPWSLVSGPGTEVAAQLVSAAPEGALHVVTDERVAGLHAEGLVAALEDRGRTVRLHVVPEGEAAKRLRTVEALWESLLSAGIERTDTIVALGGGVVGDLAGFAAATVLRGVTVMQVATTLLAMVDASLGGKTGFNTAHGKNLIGAFHMPLTTVAWLPTLRTLDPRHVRSGLAEVVKSALIDGPEALAALEEDVELLASSDENALGRAVNMAARLKLRVVGMDARERGVRAWLNLGHTLGHAIEHAQGYGVWTHGEAVAAGIVLELQLSETEAGLDRDVTHRVRTLLDRLGLPTEPPQMSIEAWMEPLRHDKKRVRGAQSVSLLGAIGSPVIKTLEYSTIATWLRVTSTASAEPSLSHRRLV